MKLRLPYQIICLVTVLLAGCILLVRGTALAQTDEQLASHCSVAQDNLRGPVRSTDLQTRVSRLQAYQYIHQRLDVFTQRLENNNQPYAAELRTKTDKLDTLVKAFKADYESYDTKRSAVASLKNCGNNQPEFMKKLESARQSRAVVSRDVAEIEALLSADVKTDISSLYGQLLVGGTSGGDHE